MKLSNNSWASIHKHFQFRIIHKRS
jgi:hypothetical protein